MDLQRLERIQNQIQDNIEFVRNRTEWIDEEDETLIENALSDLEEDIIVIISALEDSLV